MNTALVKPAPLPQPLATPLRVPGTFLLGSLPEFRSDPVGLQLRVARDFGEVAQMRWGFFTAFFVNSPAAAHEVLVEKADTYVKTPGLAVFARPFLGEGLLTSEREVHKKQRRMLAPVFAHKRIAAYGDVMVDKAQRAADRIATRETVDLAEEMMRLTLEIVGKTLFDAELAGEASMVGDALTEGMRQMINALIRLVPLPPAIPTPGNLRYRAAVHRLDALVYGLIRERRASGIDRGDMLGMLLSTRDADDGSGLTDLEVRDQATTLMLAGHETTANALAWSFYLLGQHPDVRDRIEREIDAALGDRSATVNDLTKMPLTLQVLKESMRLYPPAYVIGRKATADTTVRGVRVRKGHLVFVNVMGIHRRPESFPHPERFDPDRFAPELEKRLAPNAYLPFGGGPRVCIGNHFALMEGHLLLATLCQRLRFNLLSKEPIATEPLVTLRPRGGVPVRVTRR
jgi:cytochrome P450